MQEHEDMMGGDVNRYGQPPAEREPGETLDPEHTQAQAQAGMRTNDVQTLGALVVRLEEWASQVHEQVSVSTEPDALAMAGQVAKVVRWLRAYPGEEIAGVSAQHPTEPVSTGVSHSESA